MSRRRSEREQLVVAIGDLYQIVQRMQSRFNDDVNPDRGEAFVRLSAEAEAIAQPIIDRYPCDYGRANQGGDK